MSLQFCSFASSSSANCYYVRSTAGTQILIDAGVPLRRLESNLKSIGTGPRELRAIFLTHAHTDHVASYLIKKPFATRYGIPTYASRGTWRELLSRGCGELNHDLCHRIEDGESVSLGDLTITAHAKPHDAAGALCFHVAGSEESLAVVTDLGSCSGDLLLALADCHYYIFEANHDVNMEKGSFRPASLIQRVLGPHGHLSNEQAAEALAQIAGNAKGVWLAHLSEECNHPGLAARVISKALREAGLKVPVEPLPPRSPSAMLGAPPEHRQLTLFSALTATADHGDDSSQEQD